jgi:hypothetical protein
MKHTKNLLIACVFLLSACGGDKTEGTMLSASTSAVVDKALRLSEAYADKRIAFEGYLAFNDGATIDSKKNVLSMSVQSMPDGKGESIENVDVDLGNGKDQVQIPDGTKTNRPVGYNTTESTIDVNLIKVTTHSGEVVNLKQKLKISATVVYVKNFQTGKTNTMPMLNSDKQGFVFELKDVRFDIVK